MADDPFALSPIEARPALPTEADYQAICEAFVETSRGRWFLNEYARRNRHADTRQVLDAVERIEATLARQQMARAALSDAMVGGIADAVAQAKARALAALHGAPAPDAALAAIGEAVDRIGDVSWTLRECGADTRICDLLDASIAVIADARAHVPATTVDADAFAAIFDELTARLDALARDEAPVAARAERREPGPAADAAPISAGDPSSDARAAVAAEPEAVDPGPAIEAASIQAEPAPAAMLSEAEVAETEDAEAMAFGAARSDAMPSDAMPSEAKSSEAKSSGEASPDATLLDSALLDSALLDAAPLDEMPETPRAVAPDAVAEPVMDVARVATEAVDRFAAAEQPDAVPPAPSPRSLGAALIRGGVIGDHARPDPLAPLRKMTYAEKIALFS